MKIMYVNPQSYHNLSKYDVGFLSAVSKWECHYVCSELLDTEVARELNVYKIYSYNRRKNVIAKTFSYGLSQISLLRLMGQLRPDVVHVQWVKMPFLDYVVLYLVKKLLGQSVIYTAHNAVPHNQDNDRHIFLSRIYRLVDRIVVHEPEAQREIAQRFGVDEQKFRRIPHGAIPIVASGMPRYSAQINEFLGDAAISFCFFGKGGYYKGIDILQEAWKAISGELDGSAKLLLIGAMDKRTRSVLDTVGNDVMVIDDFVPEIDLVTAVQAAHVLVFPYRKISQSGALLSILEFRRPIIVSDIAGLIEPLRYADIGWSFDGTPEGLAGLIRQLVANPDLVREKREDQEAWEAVNNAYAWKTMHAEITSLYSEFR